MVARELKGIEKNMGIGMLEGRVDGGSMMLSNGPITWRRESCFEEMFVLRRYDATAHIYEVAVTSTD